MGFLQKLFGMPRERITVDELGRQLAAVALRTGFSEENAVSYVFEKAGFNPTTLHARREILAFTASPLEAVLFGSLEQPSAERVRDSLVGHLVNALQQSVLPQYEESIDWSATASALSMRISEYRFMLEDESGPSDTGKALILLAGRAYRNVAQAEVADPEAVMMLVGRYQLVVKHMRPAIEKYWIE